MNARSTITILLLGAGIVWFGFSWLGCEATGTMRPGAFPLCVEFYETQQHWLEDSYDQIRAYRHDVMGWKTDP